MKKSKGPYFNFMIPGDELGLANDLYFFASRAKWETNIETIVRKHFYKQNYNIGSLFVFVEQDERSDLYVDFDVHGLAADDKPLGTSWMPNR